MKQKRFLALLLAVFMATSMVPESALTAFAAEVEEEVVDVNQGDVTLTVTPGSNVTLKKEADTTLSNGSVADNTAITFTVAFADGYKADDTFKVEATVGTGSAITLTAASEAGPYTVAFDAKADEADTSNNKYSGAVTISTTDAVKETYTITYNKNDGAFKEGYTVPVSFTVTDTVTLPTASDISKEGYRFAGWYEDADLTTGGVVTTIDAGAHANKVYYAKWVEQVKASWKKNYEGATEDIADTELDKDAAVGTLPSNPSRDDYTFVEWNTKADGTGTKVETTTTVSANATYYAKWKADPTITYNLNGGAFNDGYKAPTSYKEGTGVTLPIAANVTKTGYDFTAWYDNEPCSGSAVTAINTAATGAAVFYAKWTAKTFTLSFNDGTSDMAASNNKTVTYDDTYPELPTPAAKTGYTFSGWNTVANPSAATPGAVIAKDGKVAITEDTKVYAQWEAKDVTVTITLPDGVTYATGTTQPTSIKFGADISTLAKPVKPGHTFEKWVKTGTTDVVSGTVDSEAAIAITPVFKQDYTVTLDHNYKVQETDASTVKTEHTIKGTETTVGTITDPVRSGKTFKGWYKDSTCSGSAITATTPISDLVTGDAKTFTLYAKWAEAWNVTLDYNFPNAPADKVVPVEKATSISVAPTVESTVRPHYTLEGWYTDEGCTAEKKVTFPYAPTADVTLYANWTADTYTLTFDYQGGSAGVASTTVTYDGKYPALPTTTKAGYTFKEWNTAATPSAVTSSAVIAKDGKVEITENTTVYAQWIANKLNVVFNANGGKPANGKKALAKQTIEYGAAESVKLTKNVYEKKGLTFIGWNTEADGTGTAYADEAEMAAYVPAESEVTLTLYAQYRGADVKITYEIPATDDNYTYAFGTFTGLEAVSGSAVQKTVTYKSGDKLTEALIPTATATKKSSAPDVRFEGWYLDGDVQTKLTPGTIVTKAITVKPQFVRAETIGAIEVSYNGATKTALTKDDSVVLECGTKDATISYAIVANGAAAPADSAYVTYNSPISLSEKADGSYDIYVKATKADLTAATATDTFAVVNAQWGDITGYFGSDNVIKDAIDARGGVTKIPDGLWFYGNGFNSLGGFSYDGSKHIHYTYYYTVADNSWLWSGNYQTDNDNNATAGEYLYVFYGNKLLTNNKDYTLKYSNNVNAATASGKKAPTVTITGKKNTSGKIIATFDITSGSFDDYYVANKVPVKKDKKGNLVVQKAKPVVTAYVNGKYVKLKENKDYTLSYDEKASKLEETPYASAKKWKINIIGKGNYEGEEEYVYEEIVGTNDLYYAKVTFAEASYPYNATTPPTPEPVVKMGDTTLVKNTDYTVSYYENDEVGTAYVFIEAKNGSAYTGDTWAAFKVTGEDISKKDIALVSTLNNSEYVPGTSGLSIDYSNPTAAAATVAKVLTGTAGLTYGYDKDYVIYASYSKTYGYMYDDYVDLTPGKHTIYVVGRGKYEGTVKALSYTIKKYDLTAHKADVDVSLASTSYVYMPSKTGVTPNTTVKFYKKDATHNSDNLLSTEYGYINGYYLNNTYKNNKAVTTSAQKATVTVSAGKKGYYTGALAEQSKKFEITKNNNLEITAKDKVYANKAGNFTTTVTVKEGTSGTVVKAKTDYENIGFAAEGKKYSETDVTNGYFYKFDTVVGVVGPKVGKTNKVTAKVRKAGEAALATDIVPAGTVMIVKTTGTGNYGNSDTTEYRVAAADISKAKVTVANKEYKAKEQFIGDASTIKSIKVGKVDLVYGKDYEIINDSYLANVSAGNASFEIRGLGNYGGTKKVIFKITAKSMNYTVKYVAGDATDNKKTMKNSVTALGSNVSKCGFTHAGYTFVGWSYDSDSDTVEIPASDLRLPVDVTDVKPIGSEITLTAVWKKTPVVITYNYVGADKKVTKAQLAAAKAQLEATTVLVTEFDDKATGVTLNLACTDTPEYTFAYYKDSKCKDALSAADFGKGLGDKVWKAAVYVKVTPKTVAKYTINGVEENYAGNKAKVKVTKATGAFAIDTNAILVVDADGNVKKFATPDEEVAATFAEGQQVDVYVVNLNNPAANPDIDDIKDSTDMIILASALNVRVSKAAAVKATVEYADASVAAKAVSVKITQTNKDINGDEAYVVSGTECVKMTAAFDGSAATATLTNAASGSAVVYVVKNLTDPKAVLGKDDLTKAEKCTVISSKEFAVGVRQAATITPGTATKTKVTATVATPDSGDIKTDEIYLVNGTTLTKWTGTIAASNAVEFTGLTLENGAKVKVVAIKNVKNSTTLTAADLADETKVVVLAEEQITVAYIDATVEFSAPSAVDKAVSVKIKQTEADTNADEAYVESGEELVKMTADLTGAAASTATLAASASGTVKVHVVKNLKADKAALVKADLEDDTKCKILSSKVIAAGARQSVSIASATATKTEVSATITKGADTTINANAVYVVSGDTIKAAAVADLKLDGSGATKITGLSNTNGGTVTLYVVKKITEAELTKADLDDETKVVVLKTQGITVAYTESTYTITAATAATTTASAKVVVNEDKDIDKTDVYFVVNTDVYKVTTDPVNDVYSVTLSGAVAGTETAKVYVVADLRTDKSEALKSTDFAGTTTGVKILGSADVTVTAPAGE